jgi:hypothetical protein
MDLASSGTPREEGPGGGAAASSNGSAAAAPDASALAAAADVKAEGNEEAPAGSLHETVHVVVSGAPEGAVARLGDMLLEGNPPEGEIAAGNEPVELVVTAEGYEEYSGEVVPEKHLVVKVAMTSLYPRGKGKALVASTAGPGGEDDEAKKLKKKRRKKRKKKTSGWLFVD